MSGAGGGGKNPRKFVCDIKNENLGHGDKPDFISLRVWVCLRNTFASGSLPPYSVSAHFHLVAFAFSPSVPTLVVCNKRV